MKWVQMLDVDVSGTLDMGEVRDAYEYMMGVQVSDDEFQASFDKMDML